MGGAPGGSDAWYGAAKLLELADHAVYEPQASGWQATASSTVAAAGRLAGAARVASAPARVMRPPWSAGTMAPHAHVACSPQRQRPARHNKSQGSHHGETHEHDRTRTNPWQRP